MEKKVKKPHNGFENRALHQSHWAVLCSTHWPTHSCTTVAQWVALRWMSLCGRKQEGALVRTRPGCSPDKYVQSAERQGIPAAFSNAPSKCPIPEIKTSRHYQYFGKKIRRAHAWNILIVQEGTEGSPLQM
jgi:hypothetical protein